MIHSKVMISDPKEEAGQMSDEAKSEKPKPKPKQKRSRPTTTKAQWEAVRMDYEGGNFSDLVELADKHGVDYECLKVRVYRNGWKKNREDRCNLVSQAVSLTVAQRASKWTDRVANRCEKDWELCDRSLDSIGDHADPDAVLGYSRARKLLDDMVRRSLGLRDQVDVTTGGKSIGESLVSAIGILRGQERSVRLADEDAEKIIEAEIVG